MKIDMNGQTAETRPTDRERRTPLRRTRSQARLETLERRTLLAADLTIGSGNNLVFNSDLATVNNVDVSFSGNSYVISDPATTITVSNGGTGVTVTGDGTPTVTITNLSSSPSASLTFNLFDGTTANPNTLDLHSNNDPVTVTNVSGTGVVTIGDGVTGTSGISKAVEVDSSPSVGTITRLVVDDATATSPGRNATLTTTQDPSSLQDSGLITGFAPADITYSLETTLQQITLDGGDAADTLAVDFGGPGGNPIPQSQVPGVIFNGGAGDNTLNLQGSLVNGGLDDEDYTPSGPGAGEIEFQFSFGSGASVPIGVDFSGLTTINDSTPINTVDLHPLASTNITDGPLLGTSQSMTVADGSGSATPAFAPINLTNKTIVDVDLGVGPNVVNLNNPTASDGLTNLNIASDASSQGDTVNVTATPGSASSTISVLTTVTTLGANNVVNVLITGLAQDPFSSTTFTANGAGSNSTLNVDAAGTEPVNLTTTQVSIGAQTFNYSSFQTIDLSNITDHINSITPTTLNATEGTALTDVVVASFTNAAIYVGPQHFVVTIDWGDGTTSAGTVVPTGSGAYNIVGSHTYTAYGTFTVRTVVDTTTGNGGSGTVGDVTVNSQSFVNTATAATNGTANVADANVLTPVDTTNTVVQGVSFTGTAATFTDAYTGEPTSNFTATINWGDGTTSSGTVGSPSPGVYTVTGTHVFNTPGRFAGTVTLSDVEPGTATATANSVFIVVPALVVTNTNDDGRGSLRSAINFANQFGGGTITFAVPSAGPNVLHLLSPLPTITSTTTIDDTIQSPYSQVPPAPFVIDGSLVSFGSNPSVTAAPYPALLDVNAPGSIVKGLTFQGSQGVGLVLDSNSGGSLIAGNFIGTDPSGATTSAAMGNKLGGLLIVSAGNTIQGNVISGNGGAGNPTPGNPDSLVGFGVGFFGSTASGNMLLNNEIGTNAQGTQALPNFDGVDIDGASGNTIAGNIIAGNNGVGVYLYGGTTGTTLIGNKIGIADAAHTLGNQTGVVIADSSGNRIGGFSSDTSNIVAGNTTSGVVIFNTGFQGGTDATNNVVAFSYIIANGQNGVYILNASGNQVGVSTSGVASGPGSPNGVAAGGNLIQDNGFSGVDIAVDAVPGSGGVVPSGASSIGNAVINNIIKGSGHDGIYLFNAANNLIGVGTNGVVSGNTIQGSGFSGVFLDGPASSQNRVAGNSILQSSLYGILINNGTQNLIGGTGVAGNLILGNRGGAFQVLRNNVPPNFGGLAGNHFLGSARGSQRGPVQTRMRARGASGLRTRSGAHALKVSHLSIRSAGHHPAGPLHHLAKKG